MKIAIYYGLPNGGALRTIEALVDRLKKNHQVVIYNTPNSSNLPTRLGRDLESWALQYFKQKTLALKIDSEKYDVVIVSHDYHSQAPFLLRFLKTPKVFLCQEPTRAYFEKMFAVDPKLFFIKRWYENINRFIRKNNEIKSAKFAKFTMANSNYSTTAIKKAYGIESTPVHLGIDHKIYQFKRLKRKNAVLVVGNDEPQKALQFAVEVISNTITKPTLWIATPRNNQLERIQEIAKKNKVKIKIFSGLTPYQMSRLYNLAKVGLAVAHMEPFGLSVVESQACGTPVVAVSEGGFKETVIDHQTGFLEQRNASQLAKRIDDLFKTANYKQIQKNCIQNSKKFDWDITTLKLEQLCLKAKTAS